VLLLLLLLVGVVLFCGAIEVGGTGFVGRPVLSGLPKFLFDYFK
jgi:hypothetical protein